MTYLLDVSALLALYYEKHAHHGRTERWLDDLQKQKTSVNLATCSIAELGFVRIACSTATRFVESVSAAREDLKRLKTMGRFIFLDDTLGATACRLGSKGPSRLPTGTCWRWQQRTMPRLSL